MKKYTFILLLFFLGIVNNSMAQETDAEKKFGIKWSGFIKADYMFDTRQTVNAREGHFLIAPEKEDKDDAGKDLNAQTNFNILGIQSRLKGSITGPDFFGMKTSGVLEAAFFGNSNATIGEMRLRHAFVKLSNDKVDILMGQYWHPMFVTAVFPGTYSFNTGVPFQPFSRNPQLRISTKGNLKVIGVFFTERDFKTRGASLSQAGMPQAHLQLQVGSAKTPIAGVGANYKSTLPALGGDKLSSIAAIAFFRTKLSSITWKLEAVYGENMSDLLSIGGFGTNADGDYVNNTTYSVWTEISGNVSETMEWGLFAGFTQNGGFGETVTLTREQNFLANSIKEVFRISPRIGWKSGKMKLGIEGEFTQAQYGAIDANGDISTTDIDAVSNFRLLVTAIYKF